MPTRYNRSSSDCVPIECPEDQEGIPPNCEPILPENSNGVDGSNGGKAGNGQPPGGGDGNGGDGENGGTIDVPSLFG